MQTKAIIAILLIGLLTFANSLGNGFTGDDDVKIVKNTFYESWTNVRHLFDEHYLTDSSDYFVESPPYFSSGEVSYRPMTSFFYFVDDWLWHHNPLGYHFFSLLIHLGTSCLVYVLIGSITNDRKVALLGALLFCVHPTKTEAVCSASYRHDLFAGLFSVAAFISYLRSTLSQGSRRWFLYSVSLILFGMAVFAKESAIVLPVLILAHDIHFRDNGIINSIKHWKDRYLGFLAVAFFYLYIYFYVFRNTTIGNNALLGEDGLAHGLSVLGIFKSYLFDLLVPFSVTILPPLYAPQVNSSNFFEVGIAGGVFILFLLALIMVWRKHRTVSFFLLWYLVALLPVANIIPIANPMAHRFLYLPSVGLMAAVALLVGRLEPKLSKLKSLPTTGMIIAVALVSLCMTITVPLNGKWKNDYTVSRSLVENFPDDIKGYSVLGMELFKAGAFQEAASYLQKSVELGTKDPRVYYYLGMCVLNESERAKSFFEKAIEMAPGYVTPYVGLGRLYFFEGQYQEAVNFLVKSYNIEPTYSASAYLIQSYLHLNRRQDALAVLENAKTFIKEDKWFNSLKKLLESELTTPIDVGI